VTALDLPARVPALPRSRRVPVRAVELLAVALLAAWAVHARTRDLAAPLWIDEGISLGVAHHPFFAIPGLLRQDGAPPLFYLILHLWTSAFGETPRSGHALSLACAVLAVPAAYWAAAPFGGRAGVLAAAIVALDPFSGTYAIEIRMYSLLLLVGLLATGAFLRAFVTAPGSRLWAGAFAVALAAVFYTHNWGLFFGAACGVAWLVLLAMAEPAERRPLLVAALIGFGGAALLFAPWLPTVLYQAAHTGAPWSHAPRLNSIGRAWQRVLGGNVSQTALLLLALAGAGGLLRPWRSVVSRAVLAVVVLAVVTFAIAFAWSDVFSPAWALRYLAIVLAPAAVAIAAGLSRLGVVAFVAIAVLFLGSWYGNPTHASLQHKSNATAVARQLGADLPRGSHVFSTQPEQVPLLAWALRPGYRYVTPLGPVADPRVMDWRDAMTRLDRPAADHQLLDVLKHLRPGERMLLIQPRFSVPSAPWTRRIRQLQREARRDVTRLHRTIRVVRSIVPHRGYTRVTVSGQLLERRRGVAP
jgi:mannosyltransferase